MKPQTTTNPSATTERLHGENAQLRVRVRELEEMLEDAQWSKAIRKQRLRELAARPSRFYRRIRRRM